MIPKPDIAAWQRNAPWKEFAQVEQDLVISRALVDIFSDEFLRENLAFRGGTALHKLYLHPAPRYSEDIDLVQIKSGPIGPIMQKLDEVISFFSLPRNTSIGGHSAKAFYRFESEYEGIRLKLKLEINCQEHFNVLGWKDFDFEIKNNWFSGSASIKTYDINELLGTKLRALYQRRKGRDLFDLDYSRLNIDLDYGKIIKCFKKYIISDGSSIPTQREFLLNINAKERNKDFTGDIEGLLRTGISYDQDAAFEWVRSELISKLD